MTHYFFSPHPDDAALSCGGQIAMLTRQGERVIVLTLTAGDPPAALRSSALVEELWKRWNLGMGAVVTAGRRAEDQTAMSILGAQLELWPWLDAVYRLDPITDDFIYPVSDSYFGEIPANDPLAIEIDNFGNNTLICSFVQRLQAGDTIHCPLSVGGHADHRLTQRMIQSLPLADRAVDVAYYEEYPYSAPDYRGNNTAVVVKKALDQAAIRANQDGNSAVISAATIHPLDSVALDAKIAAINCYHSQISSFWSDSEAMADSVQRYTKQVGGEREWRFIRPSDHSAPSTVS
jgi:LmbE family N-acetylglucosaminyl deacetylase